MESICADILDSLSSLQSRHPVVAIMIQTESQGAGLKLKGIQLRTEENNIVFKVSSFIWPTTSLILRE
jgi:hypothetical protein